MVEYRERVPSIWGLLMLVMFFFGGTVGYIVRDVRADAQIQEAVTAARRDVEQTTFATYQRFAQAGAALVQGARAVAESTGTALTKPVPQPPAEDKPAAKKKP